MLNLFLIYVLRDCVERKNDIFRCVLERELMGERFRRSHQFFILFLRTLLVAPAHEDVGAILRGTATSGRLGLDLAWHR